MSENAPSPDQRLATFHERRAMSVASPTGSLALTTTQWVDGEQRIWGVPGLWAPAPDGIAGLQVTVSADETIALDGVALSGTTIVPLPAAEAPARLTFAEGVTGLVIQNPDGACALRVWDAHADTVTRFGRIDSYPYNPDWVVEASFLPVDDLVVGFEHVKDEGKTRELPVPGEIVFTKDGTEYRLAAFQSGRALQLVFSDATSGVDTYSVGRFLFVAPAADGRIILDFNYAVLPPCAFSYAFNCPMPPAQNRFTVPITAGEKNVLAADGSPLH